LTPSEGPKRPKKDKTTANRKEEELQLKDSIYKLRRTRFPQLANFLLTTDVITSDDSPPPPSTNPFSLAPRSHPPPLYYLPAILTATQESFITRRKAEVSDAAEKEWELFREERSNGIAEIDQLRQRVAEEEARKKAERALDKDEMDTDTAPAPGIAIDNKTTDDNVVVRGGEPPSREIEMEVDDGIGTHEDSKDAAAEQEKKRGAYTYAGR